MENFKQVVLKKFPKAFCKREIGKYSGKVFYAIYSSKDHELFINSGSTIEKAWKCAYEKIEIEHSLIKELMV